MRAKETVPGHMFELRSVTTVGDKLVAPQCPASPRERELEKRAFLRQKNFGSLQDSWLVKNTFASWRSAIHVKVAIRREREELDVFQELHWLISEKDAMILELEITIEDQRLEFERRMEHQRIDLEVRLEETLASWAVHRQRTVRVVCGTFSCQADNEARLLMQWSFACFQLAACRERLARTAALAQDHRVQQEAGHAQVVMELRESLNEEWSQQLRRREERYVQEEEERRQEQEAYHAKQLANLRVSLDKQSQVLLQSESDALTQEAQELRVAQDARHAQELEHLRESLDQKMVLQLQSQADDLDQQAQEHRNCLQEELTRRLQSAEEERARLLKEHAGTIAGLELDWQGKQDAQDQAWAAFQEEVEAERGRHREEWSLKLSNSEQECERLQHRHNLQLEEAQQEKRTHCHELTIRLQRAADGREQHWQALLEESERKAEEAAARDQKRHETVKLNAMQVMCGRYPRAIKANVFTAWAHSTHRSRIRIEWEGQLDETQKEVARREEEWRRHVLQMEEERDQQGKLFKEEQKQSRQAMAALRTAADEEKARLEDLRLTEREMALKKFAATVASSQSRVLRSYCLAAWSNCTRRCLAEKEWQERLVTLEKQKERLEADMTLQLREAEGLRLQQNQEWTSRCAQVKDDHGRQMTELTRRLALAEEDRTRIHEEWSVRVTQVEEGHGRKHDEWSRQREELNRRVTTTEQERTRLEEEWNLRFVQLEQDHARQQEEANRRFAVTNEKHNRLQEEWSVRLVQAEDDHERHQLELARRHKSGEEDRMRIHEEQKKRLHDEWKVRLALAEEDFGRQQQEWLRRQKTAEEEHARLLEDRSSRLARAQEEFSRLELKMVADRARVDEELSTHLREHEVQLRIAGSEREDQTRQAELERRRLEERTRTLKMAEESAAREASLVQEKHTEAVRRAAAALAGRNPKALRSKAFLGWAQVAHHSALEKEWNEKLALVEADRARLHSAWEFRWREAEEAACNDAACRQRHAEHAVRMAVTALAEGSPKMWRANAFVAWVCFTRQCLAEKEWAAKLKEEATERLRLHEEFELRWRQAQQHRQNLEEEWSTMQQQVFLREQQHMVAVDRAAALLADGNPRALRASCFAAWANYTRQTLVWAAKLAELEAERYRMEQSWELRHRSVEEERARQDGEWKLQLSGAQQQHAHRERDLIMQLQSLDTERSRLQEKLAFDADVFERMRDQALCRAAEMLAGGNPKALKAGAFAAWAKLTVEYRVEKEIARRMRAVDEEGNFARTQLARVQARKESSFDIHSRRALARHALLTVFLAWVHFCHAVRWNTHMETSWSNLKVRYRTQVAETTGKLVEKNHARFLLMQSWMAWAHCGTQLRLHSDLWATKVVFSQERMFVQRILVLWASLCKLEHQRWRRRCSSRRSADFLVDRYDTATKSTLVARVFATWALASSRPRFGHRLDEISHELQVARNTTDVATERLLSLLQSLRASYCVSNVLRCWWQVAARARWEFELATKVEELSTSQAYRYTTNARMALMAWASEAKLLVQAVFSEWRTLVADVCHTRHLDEMHDVIHSVKRQAAECMRQSPWELMRRTFIAWKQHVLETAGKRVQAHSHRAHFFLVRGLNENSSLKASCLVNKAFATWRRFTANAIHQRTVDSMRKMAMETSGSHGPGRVLSVVSAIEEQRSWLILWEAFARWGSAVKSARGMPTPNAPPATYFQYPPVLSTYNGSFSPSTYSTHITSASPPPLQTISHAGWRYDMVAAEPLPMATAVVTTVPVNGYWESQQAYRAQSPPCRSVSPTLNAPSPYKPPVCSMSVASTCASQTTSGKSEWLSASPRRSTISMSARPQHRGFGTGGAVEVPLGPPMATVTVEPVASPRYPQAPRDRSPFRTDRYMNLSGLRSASMVAMTDVPVVTTICPSPSVGSLQAPSSSPEWATGNVLLQPDMATSRASSAYGQGQQPWSDRCGSSPRAATKPATKVPPLTLSSLRRTTA